ncbi:SRPBCC family protein [Gracilibacillus kekensis]|uniref:Uncharacterized conserved protein YndB, AHSA1/START domain n=1 Tax=Gracilibacillus kekensis TaxID=1027249 RepID=A0A1M7JCG3_9BACI|nr:SRPBCC family protein [Gracilibacillus kekensis]SHM50696.1 Uncharacterized conserved protein YndB, AHSA1/START domain [Gracilibacillus kekensis]
MAFEDSDKQYSSEVISEREIINTRILNTSRKQIFHAFKDPNILAQWWGPKGFSNTFYAFNLQPGETWHYVMHGPDGVDYENKSIILEVIEPEQIVLRHLEPVHEFLLTISLSEIDRKTKLIWRMTFDSVEECKKVEKFVVQANEQNLDRLEAQLASMT